MNSEDVERIHQDRVRAIVLELMRQLNCPEVLVEITEWEGGKGFTVHILERPDIHVAETTESGVRGELLRQLSEFTNTPSYWVKRT